MNISSGLRCTCDGAAALAVAVPARAQNSRKLGEGDRWVNYG